MLEKISIIIAWKLSHILVVFASVDFQIITKAIGVHEIKLLYVVVPGR